MVLYITTTRSSTFEKSIDNEHEMVNNTIHQWNNAKSN